MLRAITLFAATAILISLAAVAQSAEVVGTVVSTDPTASTVVVKTPDGSDVVYRTVETTRIQQGDATVELKNVQPGSRVQIIATPPPPQVAGETTVVYPVASGIVIGPATHPKATPKAADDDDTDIDVDIDDDDDDDDVEEDD